MHKTKIGMAQQKNKTKPTQSITPKKSLTKSREKIVPFSPRANRIHTLEAKASPQFPKKNKNN